MAQTCSIVCIFANTRDEPVARIGKGPGNERSEDASFAGGSESQSAMLPQQRLPERPQCMEKRKAMTCVRGGRRGLRAAFPLCEDGQVGIAVQGQPTVRREDHGVVSVITLTSASPPGNCQR